MLKFRQKLILWMIDLFYFPLRLFYDKCTLDRAWLMQTFKDAKCKPSYCDTTKEVMAKMIAAGKDAEKKRPAIIPLQKICEPSFGLGQLMQQIDINFRNSKIIGVEIDPTFYTTIRKQYLEHKMFHSGNNMLSLYNADFLQVKAINELDLTFMNPPYADRMFIDHVKHAVDRTKVGGSVIALVPESIFHSISWKAIKFRKFLRTVTTEVDFLGPVVCNYPVSVCMVRILNN